MEILIDYKIEKYMQLVQEALQEKKNASFIEKFAPLLEVGRNSENIEELCSRIVTEQKEMHFCNRLDLNQRSVFAIQMK